MELDYSALLNAAQARAAAPARGLSTISDALDAIMMRKEQERRFNLEQERLKQQDALRTQQLEEDKRHNRAGEAHAQSQLDQTTQHEKDALHQQRHEKAAAAAVTDPDLARALDPEDFGGAPAPAQPAAPPAAPPAAQAGIEPPAQPQGGQQPFVPPPDIAPLLRRGPLGMPAAALEQQAASQAPAPAAAPPPPMDLATAIYQGAQKRKAAELESWKTDMQPFIGNDPLKKDAYDYALRAGAHVGSRETLDKIFSERLTHLENNKTQLEGQRARAASYGDPTLKTDAANRQDASNLERGVRDFMALADSKQLLKSNRSLHAAIENIAAKGPDAVMSHKDAFVQLERYFRGGTPTDSETTLLMKHMGGIPGAIQQFQADLQTGDFSDITKRNIAAASARAKVENDKNVGDVVQGLSERFGPGSEYSNMGPQVNRHVQAIGRLYGLDLPPIYSDSGAGVVLGSGKRPQPGKAAPAKRKSVEDWVKEFSQ